MADRLRGKVALVSGAGSIGPGWGNGKATAVLYAREGASVFCGDRDLAAAEQTRDIIREEGGVAEAFRCDVTQADQVAAMVAGCHEAFGALDVLHNNVGILELGGPVDLSEEAWDTVHAVNLKSMFLTCKHALPIMEAQGGGEPFHPHGRGAIRAQGHSLQLRPAGADAHPDGRARVGRSLRGRRYR